ncbi:MAG: radical SAM protein [Candidatus Melainabacteria bacterium]|nr:radical SAM protein [Candidatus Melainabacteria bacterium]
MERVSYVYGPVRSWRSGTSLGIDPIGSTSTCSFSCAYCQLGKIQQVTTEVKVYVPTEQVIEDLRALEAGGGFVYEDLDVITFAGSGEPTLAENLAQMIDAIRELYADRKKQVPISILTNATMLNDPIVRERALHADLISLKLDAPNDEVLRSVNQPAEGVTVATIVSGIKMLALDCQADTTLQLQIMIMPKWLEKDEYLAEMAAVIKELGINKLQINTPTRAKPVSTTGDYWIDTRGNHYGPGESEDIKPDFIEFTELPVITKEQAFALEARLRELLADTLPGLEIVNVYKR